MNPDAPGRVPREPVPAGALFGQAVTAYECRDVSQAERLTRQILQREPQHVGALFMLGSVLLETDRADEALQTLQTAVTLAPQHGGVLRAYGMANAALQRWPEAATALNAALQRGQRDGDLLNNLGLSLKEIGEVDAAIAIYRDALMIAPDDADIHNNLAIALNRNHDYEAAIESYQRAIQLKPDNPDVWSNLAMLLEQTNRIEDANDAVARGLALAPRHENLHLIAAKCERRSNALDAAVSRLESALKDMPMIPAIRRAMEFELGRDYDLLGDTDRAYAHFLTANQLTHQVWPALAAGAAGYRAELNDALAYFSTVSPQTWTLQPPSDEGSDIAFILGFPRSGTTLMDTMLEGHAQVTVLEEEPFLEQAIDLVRRMPRGYPRSLPHLDKRDLDRLRAEYRRAVSHHLGSAAQPRMLVDKNPFFSTRAAFIHRLFPGARCIFALRHPCDVVLSCFMQPFGNNPVLANLSTLEGSAELYERVMKLWLRYQELFGLHVHTLRYEALVADKQRELKELIEFLGLDWDEQLTDHTPHARRRGRIYTPSYHQVIQPVYRDAVDRWRRYARYFGRAQDILQPFVEKFGYEM